MSEHNEMVCSVEDSAANVSGAQRQENPVVSITRPRIDIRETDTAYFLYAEMPGVDQTTAEVLVEKNILTIKGRTTPFEPEGFTQVYKESGDRYYERLIRLPEEVEAPKMEAVVKNGMLRIMLPKSEQSRAFRVQINAG